MNDRIVFLIAPITRRVRQARGLRRALRWRYAVTALACWSLAGCAVLDHGAPAGSDLGVTNAQANVQTNVQANAQTNVQANAEKNAAAPVDAGVPLDQAQPLNLPGDASDQKARDEAIAPAPAAGADPPVAPAPQTTAAQLEQLLREGQVTELRAAYNGPYSAHLLFQVQTLTYYVALRQEHAFWRVVALASPSEAQALYGAFVSQSRDLSDVQIQNVRLQAQAEQALRQLQARDAQLRQLQADQQWRAQQAEQVAQQQTQSRQTWQTLVAQQRDTEQQLAAIRRQINTLQAEQIAVARKPAPRRHRVTARKK